MQNVSPPSLGFSRQEHWNGLPFPSPKRESEKWKWGRSVVSDSSLHHGLQPTRLLRPWDFLGKSTGVECHCLPRSELALVIYFVYGNIHVSMLFSHILFSSPLFLNFFLRIFFFWCGPFLKSLLNFLQYFFCFTMCFFGHELCGILAPNQGLNLSPLH